MPNMHVIANGEAAFEEDKGREIVHLRNTISIARLTGGMSSGASSVAFRFELPDGRVVIAETSLKLFLGAAQIFKAKEEQEMQEAFNGFSGGGKGDGEPTQSE